MEITLLVSPGGSITFHCDNPFVHKSIALSEVESEIQLLIDQRIEEEKEEDEEDPDFLEEALKDSEA